MSAARPLPQRKSDNKLQLILERAAEVFARKGFEGASMRDLSRSTGISLSGLYHYVPSKQHLLHRIQMDAFSQILERLEARLEGADDAEQRVRILIQNHLEYFLAHPVEMKVFTHEAEALEGPYRSEVAGIKRRYYELALELFRQLQLGGRVREVDARAAVLALFGMMNWIYTWHRPGTDPEARELAETFTELFLHGALTAGSPATGGSSRTAKAAAAGAGRASSGKIAGKETTRERKSGNGHTRSS
ncbi:MAG TPA: TetR/AcrR family transcriptional regulator [Candidatus Acidoferrales bacterium]|nr:TetR/AcrR family transcriptional regulator [Candidatus Acidoferrales bacterium]